MQSDDDPVLNWCAAVLGEFELVSDHTRKHPGQRASACRIRTPSGYGYIKTHRAPAHWHAEVHAYEQWACAFRDRAPRLLAVRDKEPLAIIITELPGQCMEQVQLSAPQERAVWRSAGQALVALHDFVVGETFGPCRRDGVCAGTPINDAQEYVTRELDNWTARGLGIGCLSQDDQAIVRAARELIPAFTGEHPTPCHRDYCPANWIVNDGVWTGVIDFEFAYWDVRAADFARYPDWNWISRPDLIEAFFEGYGRVFTLEEERQRLVAHVQYALGAIVWGHENAYYGFAAEGRQALNRLGELVK